MCWSGPMRCVRRCSVHRRVFGMCTTALPDRCDPCTWRTQPLCSSFQNGALICACLSDRACSSRSRGSFIRWVGDVTAADYRSQCSAAVKVWRNLLLKGMAGHRRPAMAGHHRRPAMARQVARGPRCMWGRQRSVRRMSSSTPPASTSSSRRVCPLCCDRRSGVECVRGACVAEVGANVAGLLITSLSRRGGCAPQKSVL